MAIDYSSPNYIRQLPALSDDQLKELTITLAIKGMKYHGGLEVGQLVSHRKLMVACTLLKVQGEIAYIILPADQSPTGEDKVYQYPVDELFDPRQANNILKKLRQAVKEIVVSN